MGFATVLVYFLTLEALQCLAQSKRYLFQPYNYKVFTKIFLQIRTLLQKGVGTQFCNTVSRIYNFRQFSTGGQANYYYDNPGLRVDIVVHLITS